MSRMGWRIILCCESMQGCLPDRTRWLIRHCGLGGMARSSASTDGRRLRLMHLLGETRCSSGECIWIACVGRY